MGKIIELKATKDAREKLEEILERNSDVMNNDFYKELEELQEDYIRFDDDRLKILLLVEKLLQSSVGGAHRFKRGMGNMLPGMCTISFTGHYFDIVDIQRFKDAISLSTCCEIYSERNGNMHMDCSLYGMDANIDWNEGLRMLLEGDLY